MSLLDQSQAASSLEEKICPQQELILDLQIQISAVQFVIDRLVKQQQVLQSNLEIAKKEVSAREQQIKSLCNELITSYDSLNAFCQVDSVKQGIDLCHLLAQNWVLLILGFCCLAIAGLSNLPMDDSFQEQIRDLRDSLLTLFQQLQPAGIFSLHLRLHSRLPCLSLPLCSYHLLSLRSFSCSLCIFFSFLSSTVSLSFSGFVIMF